MRLLNIGSAASVDLAEQSWPFQQGAEVLAVSTGTGKLTGNNDNGSTWTDITEALTANTWVTTKLPYRYVKASSGTIQLISN